jgi:hypothetical protein
MQAITFPNTRLTEPMVEHEIRLRAYEIYESRGKTEVTRWKTGCRPRSMCSGGRGDSKIPNLLDCLLIYRRSWRA